MNANVKVKSALPKCLRVTALVSTYEQGKDKAGKPTSINSVTPVTVFGEEHKDKRGRLIRAIDDAESKLADLGSAGYKLTAVTPVYDKVAA